MSVYLHDIPLPQAKQRLESVLKSHALWGLLGRERIPLDEKALGRVLAEPVWAKISSPHYHAAAMDGFAVRAEETEGAAQTDPVLLQAGIQAFYVDTGDPLPEWADAVIMIEQVESLDRSSAPSADLRHPDLVRIRAAVPPWHHVRPMGEDMVATQLVLPVGHTLRPVDLGAIAGSGNDHVVVSRRPRVAVIPTGTELRAVGEQVREGEIVEYNSLVLAAQVGDWGGEAQRWPIVADDFQAIRNAVAQAAGEADLVLLNAGSSAGSEDFSARVVESLGELLVHGVAVRPGHPVILGLVHSNPPQGKRVVPIIGVPGYPVSAALTGEIFVEPLIARWLGRRPHEPAEMEATLTRKITSPAGDDDYLRVAVGIVGGKTLAAPLSRGSGVITSLVRADGILIVPSGSQGLDAGERVKIRLYRSQAEVARTILAIGSHDISLDLLAQVLALYDRRLVSSNVGSQGGLVALRRAEAHLAGSHLLDPDNGEYNISYVKRYLPGIPVLIMALVGRDQGLIVSKNNPKDIRSLQDLARTDVRYINRQKGAGTRVLLDYHLERTSIHPEQIRGYQQAEFTHLAVAAAVASGRADCGLGIAAAAQALDLTFVPLYQERYDLVIPRIFSESELLHPLFQVLVEPGFKASVARLPGYDVSIMGKIIAELE
jgi:putative molybdopterin biosynthesis protein